MDQMFENGHVMEDFLPSYSPFLDIVVGQRRGNIEPNVAGRVLCLAAIPLSTSFDMGSMRHLRKRSINIFILYALIGEDHSKFPS